MHSAFKDKIDKEVLEKFNVRLTSVKNIQGRDLVYFHIMDLMNMEDIDILSTYLKDLAPEIDAIYSGWYDGHFEYIYE
jgi:hypothetical protein